MISHFGLTGAAITLLLTRMIDCCEHYIPVSRLFSGIALGRMIWKPIVAAACMAAYLAAATGSAGVQSGVSAALVYGGAQLALTIWAPGGLRVCTAKYLPSALEAVSCEKA